MQLDWSRKHNMELKQLIDEAETENFNDKFKNQLYVMIDKMAQKGPIKQGNAEAANIGVVDLLLQISSITTQDKTGKRVEEVQFLQFRLNLLIIYV